MIDLHTHILPGVDDGADSLQMSTQMAEAASEDGVTHIVATPHYDAIPNWAQIKEKVTTLQEKVASACPDIRILPGAELYLDPYLESLSKEDIPTYGDLGNHCLLEFPLRDIPGYAEQIVFSLQVKGITPILAHPERYAPLVCDPNKLTKWLELGCLVQVNTGSILGMFGKEVQKTAEIFLTHQMAQFVASDAHSIGRRRVNLAETISALEVLELDAQLLTTTNPQQIIDGNQVRVDNYQRYKPRKRFWIF